MKLPALVLLLAAASAGAASDSPPVSFRRIQLTDKFWAEGAHAGDFDRDGKVDVVYGPFWWAGPDFKTRHEYRTATATFERKKGDGTLEQVEGFEGALGGKNAYSDNFLTYTRDFNADGWVDILVLDTPGTPARWYENPRGVAGHWRPHAVFPCVDNESPTFTDVTGDGRPELVCNYEGKFGYAQVDWTQPDRPWPFHPITPNNKYHKYTHGVGIGDVNGDGRLDLIEKDGWWEQPASVEGDPVWKQHPFVFAPPTDPGVPIGPAQLYALDVNGDGLNDVITCFAAHGYGLAWWEQVRTGNEIAFNLHMIMNKPGDLPHGVGFSQVHALELVDFDGDGLQDILTGKRFWAHGPAGDPDPNGPALLYWFQLKRGPGRTASFIPHRIDDDSGVGTQVTVADLNADGRPDVVTGNKKGAFVFLQEPAKRAR